LATSQNSENGKQNTKWLHEITWCCCDEKPVDDTLFGSCSTINYRKQNMTKLLAIDGDRKRNMG